MNTIRLFRKADSLMACLDSPEKDAVAVRLLLARPISAPDQEISIVAIGGKKELAWLASLNELDAASRRVAEEEVQRTYRVAKVIEVTESSVNHGYRYVKVRTNRGDRHFNLREPGKNVTWLTQDHLWLRDSMGNRYEVASLAALSEESRRHLKRVL